MSPVTDGDVIQSDEADTVSDDVRWDVDVSDNAMFIRR